MVSATVTPNSSVAITPLYGPAAPDVYVHILGRLRALSTKHCGDTPFPKQLAARGYSPAHEGGILAGVLVVAAFTARLEDRDGPEFHEAFDLLFKSQKEWDMTRPILQRIVRNMRLLIRLCAQYK